MRRVIVAFSLNPWIAVKLKAAAKVEGISASQLVERALARELGLESFLETVKGVRFSGGEKGEREQSGSGS